MCVCGRLDAVSAVFSRLFCTQAYNSMNQDRCVCLCARVRACVRVCIRSDAGCAMSYCSHVLVCMTVMPKSYIQNMSRHICNLLWCVGGECNGDASESHVLLSLTVMPDTVTFQTCHAIFITFSGVWAESAMVMLQSLPC